jgi:hypothetical protein
MSFELFVFEMVPDLFIRIPVSDEAEIPVGLQK